MFPLRFVPDETSIAFMKHRRWSFPFSGALIIASLVVFMTAGLNLGIDFLGGTLVQVQTKEDVADLAAMRATLATLNLGDVEVQTFGEPNEILIRVQVQEGGDKAQAIVSTLVKEALGDSVEVRRVELVGPRVSGELAITGTVAVLSALGAVLLYIWFRFEWQFAIGAIMATIHDVILTIGMFSALQLDFNLSSIAAILTIVGYSLNDTVVVYDRIRENLRKYKKRELSDILDMSINQTLSRTVLTSVTTLLALFALFILGGAVLQSFTFAMIWGVFVGTYSSIFMAAPLLILFKLRPEQMQLPVKVENEHGVV